MSAIEWVEPPPIATPQPGNTVAFVEELKERPREWARYPRPMKSGSPSMYRAKFVQVEWVVRRRADGLYDYYGRWVGES